MRSMWLAKLSDNKPNLEGYIILFPKHLTINSLRLSVNEICIAVWHAKHILKILRKFASNFIWSLKMPFATCPGLNVLKCYPNNAKLCPIFRNFESKYTLEIRAAFRKYIATSNLLNYLRVWHKWTFNNLPILLMSKQDKDKVTNLTNLAKLHFFYLE